MCSKRGVEPPGLVIVRRGREFVVEAEAVEKAAQHRVVVRGEALVLAERVRDLAQRLAEMGAQHLGVRHVVGDLAQAVHVVGEGEQPRWIASPVSTRKAWRTMVVRATSPKVPICGRPEGP